MLFVSYFTSFVPTPTHRRAAAPRPVALARFPTFSRRHVAYMSTMSTASPRWQQNVTTQCGCPWYLTSLRDSSSCTHTDTRDGERRRPIPLRGRAPLRTFVADARETRRSSARQALDRGWIARRFYAYVIDVSDPQLPRASATDARCEYR